MLTTNLNYDLNISISENEVPTSLLNKAKWWMNQFAVHGHFLELSTAVYLSIWFEDQEAALLLEGEPGNGKTSIADVVAKIINAPLPIYQIQCTKSLADTQVLYQFDATIQNLMIEKAILANNGQIPSDINNIIYNNAAIKKGVFLRALEDPSPNVVLLIDEIDKLPKDEYSEAMFLQLLGNHKITIAEQKVEVKRDKNLHPLRIILTSNLGKNGFISDKYLRETLSQPILRRCHYIYVPYPSEYKQYKILRNEAPTLNFELIVECVLFLDRVKQRVLLNKPISLSEGKSWVRCLTNNAVDKLNLNIVKSTISTLVKSPRDRKNLIDMTESILDYIRKNKASFIQKLLLQNEEEKKELSLLSNSL